MPSENYNGSVLIYNNVIKKLVSKYEKKIDEGLKEASALARDAARQGKLLKVTCKVVKLLEYTLQALVR